MAEIISVLDEHGAPTGQVLSRSDVHKQEVWHATVHAVIINQRREILVQRRAHGVEVAAGKLDVVVAGHQRACETPLAAVRRELMEEIGLYVGADDLHFLFKRALISPSHLTAQVHRSHAKVFAFVCDGPARQFILQPEEVSAVAWVPLAVLARDIAGPHFYKTYFPRAMDYYQQFIKTLQNWHR